MLRITRISREEEGFVLKLEGRLVDQWVELLRESWQVCQRKMGRPLILDLLAVEFADREGIELLIRLQEEGVRCVSWSPFLKELVESAPAMARFEDVRGSLADYTKD